MIGFLQILFFGFLPAIILFAVIVALDRRHPKPFGQLIKALFFGAIPVGFIIISLFLMDLVGIELNQGPLASAFIGTAIPEEALKLLMLWLVLRKNKYYNKKFDGIVYSCCVGLGFATFENVLYLLDFNIGIAILRSTLSVPGHFLYAVMMGYFYSLAHYNTKRRKLNMALAFLVPMLAHGLNNYTITSLLYVNEWFALLIMCVAFPAIIAGLWIISIRFMRRHLASDNEDETRAIAEAEARSQAEAWTPIEVEAESDDEEILAEPSGAGSTESQSLSNFQNPYVFEKLKKRES